MTRKTLTVIFISLLIAPGMTLHAHDMWLEPGPETPRGTSVIHQRIGHHFQIVDTLPGATPGLTRFDFLATGVPDQDFMPLWSELGELEVPMPDDRLALISVERSPVIAHLDRDTFRSYLREEGHHIETADLPVTVNERYTRHLKAIVGTATDTSPEVTTRQGLRFEIVPEVDPTQLSPGDYLPVTIYFNSAPIEGVAVTLMSKTSDSDVSSSTERTDENGHAVVRIAGAADLQLVRATHLRVCDSCADAEFESFWATLTFHTDD